MPPDPPVTILLVEDDPGHARLIERNLRRAHITNALITLSDGQQAVDSLCKAQTYAGAGQGLPRLMLLDLTLPGLDGYQVRTRLKADAHTRHMPGIILITTDEPDEIERCYALGCHVSSTTPVAYAQFAEASRTRGLLVSIVQMPQ
jgi:CheY-like chemotaxis protein